MSYTLKNLALLGEDYVAVYGGRFNGFFCPILREFGDGGRLIDGHIINKAITHASRKQVVQRKDLDGHFGTTIEPDWIELINTRTLDVPGFLRKHRKDLRALTPDDQNFPLIYPAATNAAVPFVELPLTPAQKAALGNAHVKIAPAEINANVPFRLHGEFEIHDSVVVGSLLKSAYLALFELFGYAITVDACLDEVRDALARFFRDRATKVQADQYFGPFAPALNAISGEDAEGLGDTLTNRVFVAHFSERAALFALSILLRANRITFAVTLPFTMNCDQTSNALSSYKKFLNEDGAPTHTMKLVRFDEQATPKRFIELPSAINGGV